MKLNSELGSQLGNRVEIKRWEFQARKPRKSGQTVEQISNHCKYLLSVAYYMPGAVPIILWIRVIAFSP